MDRNGDMRMEIAREIWGSLAELCREDEDVVDGDARSFLSC